jgi:thiol:disulfide interchange protein DsbD
MLKLRAGLGFALLGTIVWLIFVSGGLAGTAGMTALLALLVVVAFALWIFGLLQGGDRRWPRLAVLAATLAITWLGLSAVERAGTLSGAAPAPGHSAADDGLDWVRWDPQEITRSLEAGRPVLVVFSADWCITCKVNEQVVLLDDRVKDAIARLDVEVMKADWTKRDETIRAELARYGRAGVPMYLVYHPSRPTHPDVLPELLSVGIVLDALRAPAALANAGTVH